MKKQLLLSIAGLTLIALLSACGASTQPTVAREESTALPAAGSTEAPATPAAQAPATQVTQPTDTITASEFYFEFAAIKGEVEVRASASDPFAPAEVGQRLSEGAEIRTGADGIAALYRDSLTMLIVDNNSEIQVKTLRGTPEVPITVLRLNSGAAALEHHAEKLPEGAVFALEMPNGDTSGITGSIVRVTYDAKTKLMTASCLTGVCKFVRGDQTLTLQEGQSVDVEGLKPPPGAPSEMTTDQANQFLAMGGQLCGCEIKLSEIYNTGFKGVVPPPSDLPDIDQGNGGDAEATQDPNATATPEGSDAEATQDPNATSTPEGGDAEATQAPEATPTP